MEAILLIALYLVLARGVKLPLMRVLIVVGLMHMFLRHVRNAELLATLAPLAIAPVLARQWPAMRRDPEGKGAVRLLRRTGRPQHAGARLDAGAVYTVGLVRFAGIRPPEETMPTAALEFVREAGLTKGHVLNHYGYGGYLISAGIPTFIDGRGELFGGEFIKKYVDAIHLRGEEPEPAGEHARALGHSLDAAAQGAAGQQAARPPAGLAPGLCRRQGDDLRARALATPYAPANQGEPG